MICSEPDSDSVSPLVAKHALKTRKAGRFSKERQNRTKSRHDRFGDAIANDSAQIHQGNVYAQSITIIKKIYRTSHVVAETTAEQAVQDPISAHDAPSKEIELQLSSTSVTLYHRYKAALIQQYADGLQSLVALSSFLIWPICITISAAIISHDISAEEVQQLIMSTGIVSQQIRRHSIALILLTVLALTLTRLMTGSRGYQRISEPRNEMNGSWVTAPDELFTWNESAYWEFWSEVFKSQAENLFCFREPVEFFENIAQECRYRAIRGQYEHW